MENPLTKQRSSPTLYSPFREFLIFSSSSRLDQMLSSHPRPRRATNFSSLSILKTKTIENRCTAGCYLTAGTLRYECATQHLADFLHESRTQWKREPPSTIRSTYRGQLELSTSSIQMPTSEMRVRLAQLRPRDPPVIVEARDKHVDKNTFSFKSSAGTGNYQLKISHIRLLSNHHYHGHPSFW